MSKNIPIEINENLFKQQTFLKNVSTIQEKDNETLYTSYKYEVRIPNQYKGDFMVEMRASDLRKVRKCCEEAKKKKFSTNEIVLSVLGITIGVIITAIMNRVPFKDFTLESIFAYNICPIITAGLLVLYYKNRKENLQNVNELAEKIEEYIVDPDNDTNGGRSDKNEY